MAYANQNSRQQSEYWVLNYRPTDSQSDNTACAWSEDTSKGQQFVE